MSNKLIIPSPEPFLPVVYHPDYEMNIGEHVFPMQKYRLTLGILQERGYIGPDSLYMPQPATAAELAGVHTGAYLDDFENVRMTARTAYSELPLNQPIINGFKLAAGGTILTARLAVRHGAAMHLGGGFHHAFADHAEGFCYLNDIAVAIRALQKDGAIRRAAVVDLDLHQGNGTAHIFQDDPDVLTFSMHQEWLYPEKERSSIDIGLPNYVGDEVYLAHLGKVIPERLIEHCPELIVYVAGADPYMHDQLGDLQITMEGLRQRDRVVAEACKRHGWPIATVTAGGYARDPNDTALIHAHTAMELARVFFSYDPEVL